ncbi:hypothetical protein [Thioalkalivibrio sp. ALMg11]|uniref:hypothetical protein n=1 Tax=Thioalkalivibrio sp. ALMg11 TaxID=1158165 RepID=UPI0003710CAE|nr:hypothetical protein [Thioalkalivibrio sp. ALMg11]
MSTNLKKILDDDFEAKHARKVAGVRFAIASAYRAFEKEWGWMPASRAHWIKQWSDVLADFSPEAIQAATRRCTATLNRPPTLAEFDGYCREQAGGKPLPSPYPRRTVATMAREIALEAEEASAAENRSPLERADAYILAAALLLARANEADGIEWNDQSLTTDYIERYGRYGDDSVKLVGAAKSGYGEWAGLFDGDDFEDTDPF